MHILIVDDHQANLKLLGATLTAEGCSSMPKLYMPSTLLRKTREVLDRMPLALDESALTEMALV